jgi:hypothetical protein
LSTLLLVLLLVLLLLSLGAIVLSKFRRKIIAALRT